MKNENKHYWARRSKNAGKYIILDTNDLTEEEHSYDEFKHLIVNSFINTEFKGAKTDFSFKMGEEYFRTYVGGTSVGVPDFFMLTFRNGCMIWSKAEKTNDFFMTVGVNGIKHKIMSYENGGNYISVDDKIVARISEGDLCYLIEDIRTQGSRILFYFREYYVDEQKMIIDVDTNTGELNVSFEHVYTLGYGTPINDYLDYIKGQLFMGYPFGSIENMQMYFQFIIPLKAITPDYVNINKIYDIMTELLNYLIKNNIKLNRTLDQYVGYWAKVYPLNDIQEKLLARIKFFSNGGTTR